ncbi:hypothetical protein [Tardiphaga sp. 619_E2_N8_5]|uniref:hypothetical protein n=1 Tax=unclassified Tardiphaga TaxID=2631404 RepID=UPI003F258A41
MRNFGIVDDKLAEADFFCDLVAEGGADFFKVRYYFSAFVAAARSVTFALQASIKHADGFDTWYDKWQQQLRANELARFFHACRTDTQHIGINPVMGGSGSKNFQVCWFGQPERGRYEWLPEEDVAAACRTYMRILCELIRDCYREFGLLIDPDQIYSADGLLTKGWTLEDVEEQLGYPRGYTDIEWDGPDKTQQRLKLLRRQIPMSAVGSLLAKYLD